MTEQKAPKISIGITSMTVILCVLCLTVFSVLTLSTALSEKKFAEKRASGTENYYAAEVEATKLVNEFMEAVETGEDMNLFAAQNGIVRENDIFRFEKTIDEGQNLSVVLRLTDKVTIEAWQVVSTTDWTPDDSLRVWDGSF